jgi:uncharacterized GH25 family protein
MKVIGITLIAVLLLPLVAAAHTTVIFPETGKNGKVNLRVVHFMPWRGDSIMGIRLHQNDTATVKGLESISMIHDGIETDISDIARPAMCTVKDGKRECYEIPLSRNMISRAGDYIFVVEHILHWKKHLGYYIKKISKFFINQGGLVTDWPNRVLKDAPEIIPLSPPGSVYTGTLFRAQVVDDKGELIPHARIHVEFFNYEMCEGGISAAAPILRNRDMGDLVLFSDNSGAFSFVPPKEGIWTFTLVDGDHNVMIDGKKLQYDSSVSIAVKPLH